MNILLVDDEAIVRDWLKERIVQTPDLQLIGEARSGEAAVSFLEKFEGQVDIAVIDLAMPGMDGLATVEEVKRLQPMARVLIYTQHRDSDIVRRAQRRAQGYMLKDEPVGNILPVIRKILAGENYVSPELLDSAESPESMETAARARLQLSKLTPSEREVVALTAKGYTSRETGEELKKSHRTVEEQLRKIYRKLGINNKAEVAQFAIKAGLI